MFEIVKRNAFGHVGRPSPDEPATAPQGRWIGCIGKQIEVFAKARTVFLDDRVRLMPSGGQRS